MVKIASVIAAIAGLAYAAPAPAPVPAPVPAPEPAPEPATAAVVYYSKKEVANFDVDAGGVAIVSVGAINAYYNMFWNGFSLVRGAASTGVGVQPNTKKNVAAFSGLDTVTLQQGQPAMVSTFKGSTIDHFDLTSFYYGCVLATQLSNAAVAKTCTFTVNGYSDAAGKTLVATQTFGYTFRLLNLLAPKMLPVTLNSKFKGLKIVKFYVTNSAVTAALIDTVSYTVYSTKKITTT